MSKKRNRNKAQARSGTQSSVAWLTTNEAWETLCVSGYTSLDQNPEVITACRTIAGLISSMTIHLMANTDHGDQRIINELSRAVDIEPNKYMTRKTWMEAIVMNLLLHGSGNSVVKVHTNNGYLGDMEPIAPHRVNFVPEGYGYKVLIDGIPHAPQDLMHFVLNPDKTYPWKGVGFKAALKDVTKNLKQAAATTNGFMSSKWKPSVIVKVDALIDEFANKEGRKKLLDEYLSTSEAGEPWMVPAGTIEVEQVKPLSLSDLAIADTIQLDKRTVAAIIGVPPFVLGVGDFNASEWNNFVNTKIREICQIIEQGLTRAILTSPKMYWRFNIHSLYAYDLKNIADVYSNLYVRGIATGNEVRDKLSLAPMDGLDNLVILENYIPLDKIGDQLKLKQGGENNAGTN